jgi:hypothetical protein
VDPSALAFEGTAQGFHDNAIATFLTKRNSDFPDQTELTLSPIIPIVASQICKVSLPSGANYGRTRITIEGCSSMPSYN